MITKDLRVHTTKKIIYKINDIYQVKIEWKRRLTENLIVYLDTIIRPSIKQMCFIQFLITL